MAALVFGLYFLFPFVNLYADYKQGEAVSHGRKRQQVVIFILWPVFSPAVGLLLRNKRASNPRRCSQHAWKTNHLSVPVPAWTPSHPDHQTGPFI